MALEEVILSQQHGIRLQRPRLWNVCCMNVEMRPPPQPRTANAALRQ